MGIRDFVNGKPSTRTPRSKGDDKKCYYDKKPVSGTRILPGVGRVGLCSSCASMYDSAASSPSKPPKPAKPMGMLRHPEHKR